MPILGLIVTLVFVFSAIPFSVLDAKVKHGRDFSWTEWWRS